MKLLNALLILAGTLMAVSPAMAAPHAQQKKYEYSAFKRGNARYNSQWTRALLKEVKANRSRFERARDVEQFCPGYSGASEEDKNNCWIRLSTAIMAFESTYREKVRGFDAPSAGLMQIMAYNCQREGMDFNALLNHPNNFKCGLRMMGDLINRDGVISNEVMVQGRRKSRRSRRGLGRAGWSVMMKSHMFPWKGRRVQVGHLEEVVDGTRSYREKEKGQRACVDPQFLIFGKKFYLSSL